METKDSLSSCSNSKEQEILQLQKQGKTSKENSLNKLNALQLTIQHLSSSNYSMYNKFRDAFHRLFEADERTFKIVLSRNMQNLERQLNKETLHEKDSNSDLRVIKVQFEPFIHSKLLEPSNYNSYDLETRRDFKEANHEQVLQKRLNERKLQIQGCTFQEVKALDVILEDNAKKRCMISFRQLHSHLKRLSQNDLKGTRTESGFKRAFATLSGQDIETFTGTMFLNVEQLEKQLDKEEFQEIGSMADFNVNERQMQTTEEKVDASKALDASSVDTESSRTESKEQDTSSRSGNDAHDDDADIRPIYDEEPMAKVQTTTEINVFAIGQQHTKQPEFNNEGEVDQNAKDCHDTCPLPAKLTDNQIPEHSYQSLESENIYVLETTNIELEHKVAKLLKENKTLKKNYKESFDSIKITRSKTIEHTTSLIASNDNFKAQLQEKGFAAIAALKNELRKLKGNSVNTKFAKQSILGKPMLQSKRNQSVVRQPTAFKSERPRISEPRFASQVDVHNDLSKLVTTRYLPKEREATSAKPHHMIASSNTRISSKNMPRFSSNDMVHNHYLEEAKKKTHEHSRNSRNFSDSKHSVCSTCQQCVLSTNHDSCFTKFLNKFNSRAKVSSNKTMNRNKPVEQISIPNKQERQIPTRHRFSTQKTFVVQKKTMSLRSCLRWKSTGKIFKTAGLRWVPTGKILNSSTTKVYSEPLNGSNAYITNQYKCAQTLDVSACTLNLSVGTSFNLKEEGLRVWLLKRQISHKPGLQGIFN
uniref:Integrase, catalytic region, zinc finger, CCHC-type, peptidase aspartic, catalytic n=1 Tax=Tanacetum cinerariifolium TaxID=118510 RepID=A0A6L2NL73_TANCI|nr:hypothetical protein [Tanacetum cinerariifolium]